MQLYEATANAYVTPATFWSNLCRIAMELAQIKIEAIQKVHEK